MKMYPPHIHTTTSKIGPWTHPELFGCPTRGFMLSLFLRSALSPATIYRWNQLFVRWQHTQFPGRLTEGPAASRLGMNNAGSVCSIALTRRRCIRLSSNFFHTSTTAGFVGFYHWRWRSGHLMVFMYDIECGPIAAQWGSVPPGQSLLTCHCRFKAQLGTLQVWFYLTQKYLNALSFGCW